MWNCPTFDFLKPLDYYKEKVWHCLLRGKQDVPHDGEATQPGPRWCGFCEHKTRYEAWQVQRYMSRVRSAEQQPIQDIFAQINHTD